MRPNEAQERAIKHGDGQMHGAGRALDLAKHIRLPDEHSI